MLTEIIRDVFSRGADQLAGRISGPFHLRLIITPVIVSLFAIRAGFVDGRSEKPSFFFGPLVDPVQRRERMRKGWTAIKRVIIGAFLIDMLYQFYAFRAFYVFQTVLLVVVLAIVPYSLVRGLVTRVTAFVYRKHPISDGGHNG